MRYREIALNLFWIVTAFMWVTMISYLIGSCNAKFDKERQIEYAKQYCDQMKDCSAYRDLLKRIIQEGGKA